MLKLYFCGEVDPDILERRAKIELKLLFDRQLEL